MSLMNVWGPKPHPSNFSPPATSASTPGAKVPLVIGVNAPRPDTRPWQIAWPVPSETAGRLVAAWRASLDAMDTTAWPEAWRARADAAREALGSRWITDAASAGWDAADIFGVRVAAGSVAWTGLAFTRELTGARFDPRTYDAHVAWLDREAGKTRTEIVKRPSPSASPPPIWLASPPAAVRSEWQELSVKGLWARASTADLTIRRIADDGRTSLNLTLPRDVAERALNLAPWRGSEHVQIALGWWGRRLSDGSLNLRAQDGGRTTDQIDLSAADVDSLNAAMRGV